MGYCLADLKKGVYKEGTDGRMPLHTGKVCSYRSAELVKTFARWTYPGKPVLIYCQPRELPLGARPQITASHDECSFNAKDDIKQG